MSTRQKTNGAHFGMAFLLLSLTIVPVSMKVIGFSPRLGAIVDAWHQIAGVFGDGNQPAADSELLALNQPNVDQTPFPAQENTCQQGLLAIAETPAADLGETSQLIAATAECNRPVKRCAKTAPRVVARARVEVLSARGQKVESRDLHFVAFDVQQAAALDSFREVKSLKGLKELPSRELDLTRIMNSLPAPKEIKVLLKAKAFAPALTRCSTSSTVKNSEIEEQIRRWVWRTRAASAPVAAPDNSEL